MLFVLQIWIPGMSSRTLFWSTLFARNLVKSQLILCQPADMPFVQRHSLRMVIWCKHIVVHIICFVICALVQTLLSSQFPRILNSENKALDWYTVLIDILQMLLRDNNERFPKIFLLLSHATPHTWCDRNFVDGFVFIWRELIARNYLIVEDILFSSLE